MFSLICAWTSGWANNRDPDDLTRHRAHYEVTVRKYTKKREAFAPYRTECIPDHASGSILVLPRRIPVKRFSKFKHEPMHIWKCDSCLSVVPFPPKIMFPYVGLLKSCRCYVNTGNRLFCWEQQGVNLQRHTEPVAQNELTPFYNNRVSQMQAHHAACCELAGDRNRLPEVLYVFSINRNSRPRTWPWRGFP